MFNNKTLFASLIASLSIIFTQQKIYAESAEMTPARYAEFIAASLRFPAGLIAHTIDVKEDDLDSSQQKRRADIILNTIRTSNTLLNMYNNYQEIITKNSTQLERIDVQYSTYNIGEIGLNIINIIKDIKNYNKKKSTETINLSTEEWRNHAKMIGILTETVASLIAANFCGIGEKGLIARLRLNAHSTKFLARLLQELADTETKTPEWNMLATLMVINCFLLATLNAPLTIR